MLTWIESNAGAVINFVAIVIAYFALRHNQKKDARDVALIERIKHEENIARIARIEAKLEQLDHIDECIDSLREKFMDWLINGKAT